MRLRLTCFEEAMASRQQFDNTGSEALSGDNDATLLKKSVNLGVPLPWICYGFAPFCEIRKVCCCARQNFLPQPEYSDAITFSAVSAYLNFCKSQGKLETGWLCGMRMRMECHLVPPRTLNWSR